MTLRYLPEHAEPVRFALEAQKACDMLWGIIRHIEAEIQSRAVP